MKKKIKDIFITNDPEIKTRAVLFGDDEDTVKNKNKKQFITTKEATLLVYFDDDTVLELYAPAFKEFDGATIPFGIGKGDMRLQIPALFHDIMCDDKAVINYDRKLADTIFKECLIRCHINRAIAEYMYLHVEVFQKFCCDWRKPKNE